MRYGLSSLIALAGWSIAPSAFAQESPAADAAPWSHESTPPAPAATTEATTVPVQTLPMVPVRLAPPGPQNPQTDSYAPGPGRVPLAIESVGAPQTVGVVTGETWVWGRRTQQRVLLSRDLCLTPCLLHVRPGPFSLVTNGSSIVRVITEVDVPADGVRLQMYAPSTGSHAIGALLVGAGVVAMTLGTVWLVLYATGTNGPADYGLLAATFLGAGGASTAGGIALFAANPTGIAHRSGLAGVSSVRLGFVPQREGAGVAMTLHF